MLTGSAAVLDCMGPYSESVSRVGSHIEPVITSMTLMFLQIAMYEQSRVTKTVVRSQQDTLSSALGCKERESKERDEFCLHALTRLGPIEINRCR